MTAIQILFYLFGALSIAGALGILFTKNILYAAFSLFITFLGVAALYVLAGADFLAVVQIIIYVGGVLVLLIFGVMLTSKTTDRYLSSQTYNRFIGLLAGAGLLAIFTIIILQADFTSLNWIKQATQHPISSSTVASIGVSLMTDFVLPFEVAGILLMVALLGAAYIAGKK